MLLPDLALLPALSPLWVIPGTPQKMSASPEVLSRCFRPLDVSLTCISSLRPPGSHFPPRASPKGHSTKRFRHQSPATQLSCPSPFRGPVPGTGLPFSGFFATVGMRVFPGPSIAMPQAQNSSPGLPDQLQDLPDTQVATQHDPKTSFCSVPTPSRGDGRKGGWQVSIPPGPSDSPAHCLHPAPAFAQLLPWASWAVTSTCQDGSRLHPETLLGDSHPSALPPRSPRQLTECHGRRWQQRPWRENA